METTRDLVERRIAAALDAALATGILPSPEDGATMPSIEVVRPLAAEHGDFSTNLAMKLAGVVRRQPRDVANALVAALAANVADDLVIRAEVAGPGFVNLWLSPRHVETALDAIRAAGLAYGRTKVAVPSRINVEFVSANPTGPLTVGNARGAFVGDLLCRVLDAVGHEVTR